MPLPFNPLTLFHNLSPIQIRMKNVIYALLSLRYNYWYAMYDSLQSPAYYGGTADFQM